MKTQQNKQHKIDSIEDYASQYLASVYGFESDVSKMLDSLSKESGVTNKEIIKRYNKFCKIISTNYFGDKIKIILPLFLEFLIYEGAGWNSLGHKDYDAKIRFNGQIYDKFTQKKAILMAISNKSNKK
jgi:hypothetical protein